MTTMEIVETLRVRRDKQRHQHNVRIKQQIRAIQREMVAISFLPKPDLKKHKQLMAELKAAKLKLL